MKSFIWPSHRLDVITGEAPLTAPQSACSDVVERDFAKNTINSPPAAQPIRLINRRDHELIATVLTLVLSCNIVIEVTSENLVKTHSDVAVFQRGQSFAKPLDDGYLAAAVTHEWRTLSSITPATLSLQNRRNRRNLNVRRLTVSSIIKPICPALTCLPMEVARRRLLSSSCAARLEQAIAWVGRSE